MASLDDFKLLEKSYYHVSVNPAVFESNRGEK